VVLPPSKDMGAKVAVKIAAIFPAARVFLRAFIAGQSFSKDDQMPRGINKLVLEF
jgi:hypothetical protein